MGLIRLKKHASPTPATSLDGYDPTDGIYLPHSKGSMAAHGLNITHMVCQAGLELIPGLCLSLRLQRQQQETKTSFSKHKLRRLMSSIPPQLRTEAEGLQCSLSARTAGREREGKEMQKKAV